MLGGGDAFVINGSFGTPEKSLALITAKQRKKFTWVWVIMVIIVICLFIEKKYISLKQQKC